MITALTVFIMAVLAVASVAIVITKTGITAPIRTWLEEQEPRGVLWVKLSDLVNCPVCVGFWLSLAAVLVYRPDIDAGLDVKFGIAPALVLTVFAVHGAAVLLCSVIVKNIFKM